LFLIYYLTDKLYSSKQINTVICTDQWPCTIQEWRREHQHTVWWPSSAARNTLLIM